MNEEKRKSAALRLLNKHLQSHRLRTSSERLAILDKVLLLKLNFTPATVEDGLKDDGFRVSRATIYNTLHLFEEAGIVMCKDGVWELRGEDPVKITLVCSRCGRRKQVRDAALFRELAAKRFPSFTTSGIDITVSGSCLRCRKNG
ncbi:MAG: transcriptional repressor [Muribaculaceae bacterium]|nr:transcriptional repressor [Muribaculaceae bacterium]